jgi:hypoxanthine-guanine phosphoribosyltransferase
MNKQNIEAYVKELDEALAAAFPHPEPIRVLVVGGACLLLADVTTRTTRDSEVSRL